MKKFFIAISAVSLVTLVYLFVFEKGPEDRQLTPASTVTTKPLPSQEDKTLESKDSKKESIQQPEYTKKVQHRLPEQSLPEVDGTSIPVREDIRNMLPDQLYELVDSGQALFDLSPEEFVQLANRLSQMARDGDPWAGDALASLTMGVADNQERHMLMQMLGRSGSEKASPVLLEILQSNLDNPTEVVRISSYLPKVDGTLARDVVDALFAMVRQPGISSDVTKSLVGTIFHKGGRYGQQLAIENEMVPFMN
ncbi:hypothetical protein [Desulfosarcina ovata]|uniref:HEAT repeat domain-containing protein n=1 Tax=Desulfosarcina ovata subsp. ovata TaxID=2752305 RepID=A0A5K8A5C9_9BACT|nr:hypothetical protein [Desulfosarcina ovata]BBO87568.1 hypothetical protein DSCOOX_07480 [Desulfosarcina ovata subsp. ovata]